MSESSRRTTRTVAIVGAGIAGLTLALCLERLGFRVEVYERAAKASTQGAGIQISPNALKILDGLGLSRAILAAATTPESIKIYDGRSGEQLTEFQLGTSIKDRHDAAYLVLHRADLQAILLTACESFPDIDINFDAQVTDVASHMNGVTLMVQKDGVFHDRVASAAVGADGVWSSVRKHVAGATEPQFTGSVAWRSLMDIGSVPKEISLESTSLWIGPKAHVVTYPVRQGQLLNTIAITPWAKKAPLPNGWQDKSEAEKNEADRSKHLSKWASPIPSLLAQKANWGGWPIYASSTIGTLADGLICLIGDAAHSMVPYSAQGGASAIEDAAVVAQYCGQMEGDFERAFKKFERARITRLKKIVNLSFSNGKIYHMGFPASAVRNAAMKHMSQERLQKRMNWLYGWSLDDLN